MYRYRAPTLSILMLTLIMSGILLGSFSSTTSSAATIPPVHGTTPADFQVYSSWTECDAYVRSDKPTSNFGTESILNISKSATGSESVVFVKFNISGLHKGDIISSASVYLSIKDGFGEGLKIGAFYCTYNNWSEDTITWANAPWTAIKNRTVSTSSCGSDSRSYQLDFASALQDAIGSDYLTAVFRAQENGQRLFWAHDELPASGMNAHLYVLYTSGAVLDTIKVTEEISSGYLSDISLWYTWINTGWSQLIYITAADTKYNNYFPGISFVGQHYFTKDNEEIVVGHSLLLFELYNDTNHNGILDANFENDTFETAYYLALNYSTGFEPQDVRKVDVNGTIHYKWGVRYKDVLGYLTFVNGTTSKYGDTAAFLKLTYLETSYDYSLQGNTTSLKTNLSLGTAEEFQAIVPGAHIEGLSLSALHSTMVLSNASQPVITVNSTEYNSTQADEPTIPIAVANITSADNGLYGISFDEYYRLYTDPESQYQVRASACPSSSLHESVAENQFWTPVTVFRGFLSAFLPRILEHPFPVDIDYRDSWLLYRIGYPHWDGYALAHDPTYTAYVGRPIPTASNDTSSETPNTETTTILQPPLDPRIIVLASSALAIGVVVLLWIRKKYR
ncbi:MAG: DNRLRE domain-containing protein [Candidatus Thorarchaeota archaeon]|nr:DNRLRE domain-containing protein [Candidatus Thorarchaeota archaeon]